MATILWIGDEVTLGTGASDNAHRMSSLVSAELSLDERNAALAGTGFTTANGDGKTFNDQIATTAADTSFDHTTVSYIVIAGGILDTYDQLANLPAAVKKCIQAASAGFPKARIVVGVAPGCIPIGADIEQLQYVATSIRLAAQDAGALAVGDMHKICGTDPALVSSGIAPNDAGHALLAQALLTAMQADAGEPVDTPVTDLQRRYTAGGAKQSVNMLRQQKLLESQKKEAARPTGSEKAQTTAKLNEITQKLDLQQKLIAQQQEIIKKQQQALADQQKRLADQQTDMVRRTPQPEGRTQFTGSAQAGTTPNTLHTYGIAIPAGKAKAFVSISATASTTDKDATPLLEVYEDGTLVSLMTIPDILPANGLSFSQTVTENHSYTVRVATVTGSALVRNITSWFTVIYYV